MGINLRGRSVLKIADFSEEEILYLLDLAEEFKRLKLTGTDHKYLSEKNIVLLFEKTSTRTRSSFEVAGFDLGMGVTFLNKSDIQMSKKESIEDTARVLGRYYDAIEYRGFGQEIVEEISKYAGVPVYNGLTNQWHPTQMLADMLTIRENFKKLHGLNFVYMGDARNNMANSLAVTCAKLGINFTALAPKDLWPEKEVIDLAKDFSRNHHTEVNFSEEIDKNVKNADIIYTDTWVSMGEAAEVWDARIRKLYPYQVNQKIMDMTNDDAIFMHCLPAFHDINTEIGKDVAERFKGEFDLSNGMEVTDEVFRSGKAKSIDQVENRIHTIKAMMYATLK